MKKIHLIIASGTILSTMMIQSCQQPEADPAAVEAKVVEAYNAQKTAIENEAATACDDLINSKVQAIKDSMATMSAKQQEALLAKQKAALAAAQKKATADAKKKAAKPVVKTPTKTAAQEEQDRKAKGMGSGTNAPVKVTAEDTKNKANNMGSGTAAPVKVTEEDTKNKASRMGGN